MRAADTGVRMGGSLGWYGGCGKGTMGGEGQDVRYHTDREDMLRHPFTNRFSGGHVG